MNWLRIQPRNTVSLVSPRGNYMNIQEFIQQGGKCRAKAGYDFILDEFDPNDYWCIVGKLQTTYNYKIKCKWDKHGVPQGLPYTHGLDLLPVIPITTYKMIKLETLAKFDKIEDLMESEAE